MHFPYCVHRCFYCDFNLITPKVIPQESYTKAVISELKGRAGRLEKPAHSLYFGGGTPSLWEPEWFARVIDTARESPGLLSDAEITLEANPSDVSQERCERWLEVGINRVSLGIQSFDTRTLTAADRRHTGIDSLQAVKIVRSAGFDDLSIDLMFGLPGQTDDDWSRELDLAMEMNVPHLSIYGLTVEEATPLHGLVKRGEVVLPKDEASHRMFFLAHDRLRAHGYEHYEVSAYARPGHRAVHNSAYWAWKPFLGLGAGAHGFDGRVRWENIRRVKTYIEHASSGMEPTANEEGLEDDARSFERLMVGLRRLEEGVSLDGDCERFRPTAEKLIERGWLEKHAGNVRVTREGLRWMNDVLAEFI